jgi:hypothetical protein
LLFLPPCGLHLILLGHRVHRAVPTCLSTPRRPRNAKTFRARSSPAPMKIKPQPARAILGQESAHTTLSITHHTKEQPSDAPVLTPPIYIMWVEREEVHSTLTT